MREIDVAVIGAGPYGLSLSTYLRNLRVEHIVFGTPMGFWRESTPAGMELKSEGSSSDLFDARNEFSIEKYYREISQPFDDRTIIPAEVFLRYGLAFEKRFVPDVDHRKVELISHRGGNYHLMLRDGTQMRAARVVVATGICDYAHIPSSLRALPKELLTHSVEYGPLDRLLDRNVIVIGGGASAVDLAWSLCEHGCNVTLLCRQKELKFRRKPLPPKWYFKIRSPDSPIGGGWELWFYANAPNLFRFFSESRRLRIIANVLGPAPGWFMTDRVLGRVPILGGLQVIGAQVVDGRVLLQTKTVGGQVNELTADHVVAATGYLVDVTKLPFLDEGLKAEVRLVGGWPVLSANFESFVPGLYFIGAASAASFGPVMRFVAGAKYTVRRLAPHLARSGRVLAPRSDSREIRFVE